MNKFLKFAAGAAGLFAFCCACPADAKPVALDVRFKLTDLEYKPLPGVPIRLVFGSDANWQSASAGQKFTTDEMGQVNFTTTVDLDKRWRKISTNYLDSLLGAAKQVDHLQVAAELEYANFQRLYVVDIAHFSGGDCLLDGYHVYSRDDAGGFTQLAQQTNDGWKMPEYKGLIVGGPGFAVANFLLVRPDPEAKNPANWTLDIAFKKYPPPVMQLRG